MPFIGATLAWDDTCDRWLAFGGITPGGFVGALLVRDAELGVWVPEIAGPGSPAPPARALCAAVVAGAGTLMIFGGDSGGSLARDDTWIYDFTCHWWAQFVPRPGDQNPDPRVHGDLSYDEHTGVVLLRRGAAEPGGPPLDDGWRFDLEAQRWTQLW